MIEFPANIKAIKPYKPGPPLSEVARKLGLDTIHEMASNESPYGPSPGARQAFRALSRSLHHYPDSDGYFLRRDLSRHLGPDPDWFILGNGSCELIELLAKATLGRAGNGVFSEGAFIMMRIAIMTVNGKVKATPMKNYGQDLKAMAAAVDKDTRLVYLANPNNPTGTWLKRRDILNFYNALPKHCLLIVDEAYREYAEGFGCESLLGDVEGCPNLVVLGTFSKAYALAGLRIGYGCAHPDVLEQLGKVRSPFNTNQPAQEAARASLEDQEYLARTLRRNQKEMAYLKRGLGRLGFELAPSAGNFWFCQPPKDWSLAGAELSQALLKQGLFIRPLGGYGFPRHVRISAGTRGQNRMFLEALHHLKS